MLKQFFKILLRTKMFHIIYKFDFFANKCYWNTLTLITTVVVVKSTVFNK